MRRTVTLFFPGQSDRLINTVFTTDKHLQRPPPGSLPCRDRSKSATVYRKKKQFDLASAVRLPVPIRRSNAGDLARSG